MQANPRLTAIKKKLFEYMKKEKLDLETIFKIADKDKSNGIELIELKT